MAMELDNLNGSTAKDVGASLECGDSEAILPGLSQDGAFVFSDESWRKGLMGSLKLMLYAPLLCGLLIYFAVAAMGEDSEFVMPTLIGLAVVVTVIFFAVSYKATRVAEKYGDWSVQGFWYRRMIWLGFGLCIATLFLSFPVYIKPNYVNSSVFETDISHLRYFRMLMMMVLPVSGLVFLIGYFQLYRLIAVKMKKDRLAWWTKFGTRVLLIGMGLHVFNAVYTLAFGWWHVGVVEVVMWIFWMTVLPMCFLVCFHYLSLIHHSLDLGKVLREIDEEGDGVSAGVIGTEIACVGCGYNVKGLGFERSCPECGCENSRTISDEHFLFSRVGWRRGLARGLWLIPILPMVLVVLNLVMAMGVEFYDPNVYQDRFRVRLGSNIDFTPFVGFTRFHAGINYYVVCVFVFGITWLTGRREGKQRGLAVYGMWVCGAMCLYLLFLILFDARLFEGLNPRVKYLCVFGTLYLNFMSYRFAHFSKRMRRSKLAIAGRLPFILLVLSVLLFVYGLSINLFGQTLFAGQTINYKGFQAFGFVGSLAGMGASLLYLFLFSFFQILGIYDSINRGEVRARFLPKQS